ncbi:hypothetical protein PM082_023636 [Marasmius tenuissimus]|nr:hypothetical protein PM082_023636 [Marasmius tenuissimus]
MSSTELFTTADAMSLQRQPEDKEISHLEYLTNADPITRRLVEDACTNAGWGAYIRRKGTAREPPFPAFPDPILKEVPLPAFDFEHREWLKLKLFTDFAAYAWNDLPVRGINFVHQLLIDEFAEMRLTSTGDWLRDDKYLFQQKMVRQGLYDIGIYKQTFVQNEGQWWMLEKLANPYTQDEYEDAGRSTLYASEFRSVGCYDPELAVILLRSITPEAHKLAVTRAGQDRFFILKKWSPESDMPESNSIRRFQDCVVVSHCASGV